MTAEGEACLASARQRRSRKAQSNRIRRLFETALPSRGGHRTGSATMLSMPAVAIVLLIAGGTHLMMAEASEIQGCPSLFASLGTASGTIASSGLPELGKWMLDRSGSPAHWLGEIYDGKKLREPILSLSVRPCTDMHVDELAVLSAACKCFAGSMRTGDFGRLSCRASPSNVRRLIRVDYAARSSRRLDLLLPL